MGRLAGDVSVFSIADLLQFLSQNGKEGVLSINMGEHRKTIYLSPNGMRLLRTTSRRTNSLGEILIRTRKITRDQLDQYLDMQRKTGKKLGEIVGKLGIVTKRDIDVALKEQVAEEIFDLFSWPTAQFEFVEGAPGAIQADTPLADHVIEANASSLMLEAARRNDELQLIMKVIRDEKMIVMKTTKPFDSAGMGDNPDLMKAVYAQINGRHAAEEVIRRSLYPRFDALRALYLLATSGFIKLFDREGATVVGLRAESTRIRLAGATPPSGVPAPSMQTPLPGTPLPNLGAKTILLLGEMLKYRGILAALLREANYEVIEEVAAQALAILTQGRKIDAIILDIGISTNDGFQFCAWLAENTSAPIVVLSTDPSKEAADRAASCNARGYIVKPFTREVLLERVAEFWKAGATQAGAPHA
jgi:CheY-like chemotaxis protein